MEKLNQVPGVLQSRGDVPRWQINPVLDHRLMEIALRESVQGKDGERLGREEIFELVERRWLQSFAGGNLGKPEP